MPDFHTHLVMQPKYPARNINNAKSEPHLTTSLNMKSVNYESVLINTSINHFLRNEFLRLQQKVRVHLGSPYKNIFCNFMAHGQQGCAGARWKPESDVLFRVFLKLSGIGIMFCFLFFFPFWKQFSCNFSTGAVKFLHSHAELLRFELFLSLCPGIVTVLASLSIHSGDKATETATSKVSCLQISSLLLLIQILCLWNENSINMVFLLRKGTKTSA